MRHRVARLASAAALAAGLGVGLFTYYGPTGMSCRMSGATVRGDSVVTATPTATECQSTRLADADRSGTALALIALWSMAPALALAGSFGPQPVAVALASIAFLIQLSSFIGAMSVGFLYFFVVMPLTGLALAASALRGRLYP